MKDINLKNVIELLTNGGFDTIHLMYPVWRKSIHSSTAAPPNELFIHKLRECSAL